MVDYKAFKFANVEPPVKTKSKKNALTQLKIARHRQPLLVDYS